MLNDDAFISSYVILMFFFPIFFFFYLFSFDIGDTMGIANSYLLYIASFIIISVLLLVFIGKSITDKKNREDYLTIISCTTIALPILILILNVFSNVNILSLMKTATGVSTAANFNIKIITSAILMSIIYMNLIITNVVNYDEIKSNKLLVIIPSLFVFFLLFINNTQSISGVSDIFIKTITESQPQLIKYGILYLFIVFVGVILYFSASDNTALSERSYIYSLTAIIPLIILFSFIIPIGSQNSQLYKMFFLAIVGILFTAIIYSYSSLNKQTFNFVSYVMNFLLFLIILFGLAIFFYIFGNYFKSLNNFSGFIVYFIFYIPCLIIDFFKYMLKEFRMTSSSIYVLFIIEALLILTYLYSKNIINYFITKTTKNMVLLEKTEFLDMKTTISSNYDLRIKHPIVSNTSGSFKKVDQTQSLDSIETYSYRKRYALSMWVYLNNQPPNNMSYSKETEIFNYGDGKPRITYYNDITTDSNKDKYIFYFTNSTDKISSVKMTLPGQKWNYIVFNYYSDRVDLFINGNLEKSYVFDNNMPTYLATDNITVGTKDGLDGAICNVNYFIEPLTKSQITNAYNLLMMRNPPTLVQ
jgi:hypothetical protein